MYFFGICFILYFIKMSSGQGLKTILLYCFGSERNFCAILALLFPPTQEIYYIPSQGFELGIKLRIELRIMMEKIHYKKDFICISYNTFKIEI